HWARMAPRFPPISTTTPDASGSVTPSMPPEAGWVGSAPARSGRKRRTAQNGAVRSTAFINGLEGGKVRTACGKPIRDSRSERKPRSLQTTTTSGFGRVTNNVSGAGEEPGAAFFALQTSKPNSVSSGGREKSGAPAGSGNP